MATTDSPDRAAANALGTSGDGGGAFSLARVLGFLGLLMLAVLVLPLTEADPTESEALAAQLVARQHAKQLGEVATAQGATAQTPQVWEARYVGPPTASEAVLGEFKALKHVQIGGDAKGQAVAGVVQVLVQPQAKGPHVRVTTRVTPRLKPSPKITNQATLKAYAPQTWQAHRRSGGWEAVLPPLIAVLIAVFFRRLILGLVFAVWFGAALYTGLDPASATSRAAGTYLWGNLSESFNLYIMAFTLLLVGMVMVITRMGGGAGLIKAIGKVARSARTTRIATALMGTALFFDDYANTVVVGTTARSATDRWRVSREKLAYLVDSTSAPIAGIAIISTWIGYEVGLFQDLSDQLGMGMSGYDIFFHILPMRFYCLFTLAFLFFNSVTSLDYGPMLRAERRARRTGQLTSPTAKPLASSALQAVKPDPSITPRWENAAIPVLTVIGLTLLGMFWSGWRGPSGAELASIGQLFEGAARPGVFLQTLFQASGDLFSFDVWRDAFARADNAKVLFFSALIGGGIASALALIQGLDANDIALSWMRALPAMGGALAILVLAWCMRSVCDDLGTHIYLIGATRDLLTPQLLPLITFLLAAIVAFATGTSWGTMGILLPAMIPLAWELSGGAGTGVEANVTVLLCFGAVLDGAIFGDHCSPISDTTVMSSIASSCDHMDHVKTQIPYALTTMMAAAIFGYVGVAIGLPLGVALLSGVVGLLLFLLAVGQRHGPRADMRQRLQATVDAHRAARHTGNN